jgi:glutathione S-transferase
MTITITAFERSPDGGKGLARDTRVRWALEEVGQPYQVRLVSFRAMKEPPHLALHPFGQIPTYEEGDLALFESGAIVFHIAERHAGLLPDDASARARAITWMFAALSTVEPPILELGTARLLEGDKPWSAERLPLVKGRVGDRLDQLSVRLGDADWLDVHRDGGLRVDLFGMRAQALAERGRRRSRGEPLANLRRADYSPLSIEPHIDSTCVRSDVTGAAQARRRSTAPRPSCASRQRPTRRACRVKSVRSIKVMGA